MNQAEPSEQRPESRLAPTAGSAVEQLEAQNEQLKASRNFLYAQLAVAHRIISGTTRTTESKNWLAEYNCVIEPLTTYPQNAQAEARHRMPLPPAPGSAS